MNIKTIKLLRNISKIVLVLVGVGLLGYLGYLTYQSVTFSPRKVRITNITENSATISWVTDTPTKGVVYYKQEDSFLPGPLGFVGAKKAYDDRDYYGAQLKRVNDVNEKNLKNKDAEYVVDPENIDYEDFKVTKLGDYYTHHVTIRGLDPVSKYYFVVSDNWFSWSIDGVDQSRELTEVYGAVEFNFTTFDRLNSVPSPNPAYGKVVGVYRDENGFVHDNLNQDTVVYGFLFDEESLDQTSMYSSVTNEEGGWVIDKSSMRAEDGSLPYNFKNEEDLLVLYPQYMNIEESFSVGLVLGVEDSPAPDLVGGQEMGESAEEEESLLNNVLGKVSGKLLAAEVIDEVDGALLVRRVAPSLASDSNKGSIAVVGRSEAASTMRKTIEEAKKKNSNISNDDLVNVVGQVNKAVKDGKSTPNKETPDEIIDRKVNELVVSEATAEDLVDIIAGEVPDIRNTQTVCKGSKDDWAINCYNKGNEKLPTCGSGAVASGCGTASSCYSGGYGYENKCVGCARPASCMNVWERADDVLVNGQLYTRADIWNVALGNTDDNPIFANLVSSLKGKTICTNADGGKIMAVVNNPSSCPKYSIATLNDFQPGNLSLGDTDGCRTFVRGLNKNIDVDKYCKDVEADPNKTPPISNATSWDKKNPYDCTKLSCEKGFVRIYRRNQNLFPGCFCGPENYLTGGNWIGYDGEVVCKEGKILVLYDGKNYCVSANEEVIEEVDQKEYIVRKKYRIDVNDFLFSRDVTLITGEIKSFGGIIQAQMGTSLLRTDYLIVWMSDAEYEALNTCLQNSSCTIKNDTISGIKPENGERYYIPNTSQQIQVYSNNTNSYVAMDDQELTILANNLGITTDDLISNIQTYVDRGFVAISERDTEGIFTVSVNLDEYSGYSQSLSTLGTVNSIKYGGSKFSTIYPEESGEYKMSLLTVCPKDGNDYEFCLTVYGREEEILSDLGIEEYEDLYEVRVDSSSTQNVKYCPEGSSCTAMYTVTYEDKLGEEKTEEFELPYVTDAGVRKIEISNDIYTFIPNESTIEIDGDTSLSDVGNSDWFSPAIDTIKSEFESNLYEKILGIFSPTKVQAQQLDKYVEGSNDKGLYEIITSSGKTVHYVDTSNKSYIIFYEEGNNEPGFQEPLDINNPQEGEDVLVFVNKDSVKKISQAYQYWIEEGINMMSFPFLPVNQERKAMMASDLMISNNTVVGKISQITYFENGKWQGGIKASGDNKYVGYDFPLVPGRGYLIVGEYGTNISIPGFPLSEPFPVELSAGWNFVGVHGYPDIYTAEKLIDELDKLEGIDVDNVTWWPRNLGRYEGLQKTGSTKYGFDYPLSDRLAYFVRVASYSNKCPRSVLWNPGGESHGICGSN